MTTFLTIVVIVLALVLYAVMARCTNLIKEYGDFQATMRKTLMEYGDLFIKHSQLQRKVDNLRKFIHGRWGDRGVKFIERGFDITKR